MHTCIAVVKQEAKDSKQMVKSDSMADDSRPGMYVRTYVCTCMAKDVCTCMARDSKQMVKSDSMAGDWRPGMYVCTYVCMY
jgi:hypothetical protein